MPQPPTDPNPPPFRGILIALALISIAMLGLGVQSADRYLFNINFQSQILAFAGYAYLAYGVLYRRWGSQRWDWILMALVAISLRIALSAYIPAETLGSRDAHRYLFEGNMTLGGFNPYLHAPNSRLLNGLPTGDLLNRLQYASISSPYPPGAQLLFALGALLGGTSLWGFKLLYLAAEILLFFSLRSLCRRFNLPNNRLALVFLNPFLLREAYLYGHFDLVPISLVIASAALALGARRWLAGAVFGLAATVKIFPILLAPLLLKRFGVRGVVAASLTAFVIGFPFWLTSGEDFEDRNEHFMDGFTVMSLFMKSNVSPIFEGMYYTARHFVLTAHNPTRWTQRTAALVTLAAACALAIRFRRENADKMAIWGLSFCITILLTLSTLANPWYFIWLVPFLVFFPSIAWISLMALSILFTYPRNRPEYEWLIALEWTPFILLYAWESVRVLKTGNYMGESGKEEIH